MCCSTRRTPETKPQPLTSRRRAQNPTQPADRIPSQFYRPEEAILPQQVQKIARERGSRAVRNILQVHRVYREELRSKSRRAELLSGQLRCSMSSASEPRAGYVNTGASAAAAAEVAEANVHIVMDNLFEGELFDRLCEARSGFAEEEAQDCMLQIAEAVAACHDAGVAHLDIKPENFMIRRGSGRCDGVGKLWGCDVIEMVGGSGWEGGRKGAREGEQPSPHQREREGERE